MELWAAVILVYFTANGINKVAIYESPNAIYKSQADCEAALPDVEASWDQQVKSGALFVPPGGRKEAKCAEMNQKVPGRDA